MGKAKLSFLVIIALSLFAVQAFAQMKGMENPAGIESPYPNFIFGHKPIMYLIDIYIIIIAGIAIYYGSNMMSGELKSAFSYIFAGIIIISINYLLELSSMISGVTIL